MGFNKKRFYELIGCKEDADLNTVKKAYRELIKEFHPDILRGEGINLNIIRSARLDFNKLQNSYENFIYEIKEGVR